MSPLKWKIRICEVPSSKGLIRIVSLKTSGGIIKCFFYPEFFIIPNICTTYRLTPNLYYKLYCLILRQSINVSQRSVFMLMIEVYNSRWPECTIFIRVLGI